MKVDILTLFPGMLGGFLSESIIGKAVESGIIDLRVKNLRNWANNRHNSVDDRPFGGGAGMVMRPEPLFSAISELKTAETKVVYMCPDGKPLSSKIARELSLEKHLVLVSGHYEGIDERVRELAIDEEISIGDYVLTNGTLPAAVLLDAVVRYIPGVLGCEQSLDQDSFGDGLLAHPQYTRPAKFLDLSVPDVLLSGDHEKISAWRTKQRIARTIKKRPDLIFNR